ncbi:unnamed protein product [Echinostoma caproni]|uniref:Uncharacterized protein n=1 Tax=Echinostoma caproni TaxID=27848 RepID=A0A183B0P9_9TREM|nr:unnamed protein product [Echinostoma caproni]
MPLSGHTPDKPGNTIPYIHKLCTENRKGIRILRFAEAATIRHYKLDLRKQTEFVISPRTALIGITVLPPRCSDQRSCPYYQSCVIWPPGLIDFSSPCVFTYSPVPKPVTLLAKRDVVVGPQLIKLPQNVTIMMLRFALMKRLKGA